LCVHNYHLEIHSGIGVLISGFNFNQQKNCLIQPMLTDCWIEM